MESVTIVYPLSARVVVTVVGPFLQDWEDYPCRKMNHFLVRHLHDFFKIFKFSQPEQQSPKG